MSKNKILIVDDNPHAVSLVSIVLKRNLDCELSVAFDGSSAIKQAREAIPDLILMDWQMPGIDGIRAIEILKEDEVTRGIPIIMITCYTEQDYLQKAVDVGVSDFIRKPFDSVELLARVNSLLAMQRYYAGMLEAQKRETATLSLQQIQNEEFRTKIASELMQVKQTLGQDPSAAEKQLDNLIERLKGDSAAGSWSQLEKRIKDTDQPFFKHIGEKHPKLTPAELKLCYYLRMNLSTKEIAGLTYQTYDSVRIARTRLRKKLQLTGDDNLVAYLAPF